MGGRVDDRPRDRARLEDLSPDLLGLFRLALKFQTPGLALPFLARRLQGGHLRRVFGPMDREQPPERMAGLAFDHDEGPDRASDGHVKRIDVELIRVERLVRLVFRARIGGTFGQILGIH